MLNMSRGHSQVQSVDLAGQLVLSDLVAFLVRCSRCTVLGAVVVDVAYVVVRYLADWGPGAIDVVFLSP